MTYLCISMLGARMSDLHHRVSLSLPSESDPEWQPICPNPLNYWDDFSRLAMYFPYIKLPWAHLGRSKSRVDPEPWTMNSKRKPQNWKSSTKKQKKCLNMFQCFAAYFFHSMLGDGVSQVMEYFPSSLHHHHRFSWTHSYPSGRWSSKPSTLDPEPLAQNINTDENSVGGRGNFGTKGIHKRQQIACICLSVDRNLSLYKS